MKRTKRKGFNFLRSYFDVLNQLETNEDKLNFLLSIINKQFLDSNPEGLNFIVNLAYESQRHQLESSVKGWKDKAKTDLKGDPLPPPSVGGSQGGSQGGTEGGRQGGTEAPSVQEKEKEKEKEKEELKRINDLESLLIKFKEVYPKGVNPMVILPILQQLPKDTQQKAINHIPTYIKTTEPKYIMKPENYLSSFCWEDRPNDEPKQPHINGRKLKYFN